MRRSKMLIQELKRLNRVKINVDENVYHCDHLIEARNEVVQECERCNKEEKLWFPEEDPAVGLCDSCLIESYGDENIEALTSN